MSVMGEKRRVTAWVEDITDRAAEPMADWVEGPEHIPC